MEFAGFVWIFPLWIVLAFLLILFLQQLMLLLRCSFFHSNNSWKILGIVLCCSYTTQLTQLRQLWQKISSLFFFLLPFHFLDSKWWELSKQQWAAKGKGKKKREEIRTQEVGKRDKKCKFVFFFFLSAIVIVVSVEGRLAFYDLEAFCKNLNSILQLSPRYT